MDRPAEALRRAACAQGAPSPDPGAGGAARASPPAAAAPAPAEPASAAPDDPLTRIDALRAAGLAGRDPVGFRVVEALARRLVVQQGEARESMRLRLEHRIRALRAGGPEKTAACASAGSGGSGAAAPPGAANAAALSALVDRLGRPPGMEPRLPPPAAPAAARAVTPGRAAARPPSPSSANRLAQPAPKPLKSVLAFKRTWSRLRADQRLRQAYDQVPSQAGPLNSAHVVNRALQTMRELSPAYLDAFMAHVDALLALEHANGLGDLTPRAPAATAAGDPRSKPRARPRRSSGRGAGKG